MLLERSRVVVTGGASGIAAATVRCCVREGANVAVLDVNTVLGSQVVDAANNIGPGHATFFECDISDRQMVFDLFEKVHFELGGIDVLINVAGILLQYELAEEIDIETWDTTFDVNLKGTLFTNQAACKYMKDRGQGNIINFASSSGVLGSAGIAAYSASKGAVISWTRAVAQEWGRYGIRVNMVNPVIETPLRHGAISSSEFSPEGPVPKEWAPTDEMFMAGLKIKGSGGSKGDPDLDLGPVIIFLASNASHFITGQMINIDGGMLLVR